MALSSKCSLHTWKLTLETMCIIAASGGSNSTNKGGMTPIGTRPQPGCASQLRWGHAWGSHLNAGALLVDFGLTLSRPICLGTHDLISFKGFGGGPNLLGLILSDFEWILRDFIEITLL